MYDRASADLAAPCAPLQRRAHPGTFGISARKAGLMRHARALMR
jgi:hypothetical protein